MTRCTMPALALAALLAGCGSEAPNPPSAADGGGAAPAGFLLAAAPSGARPVSAAKTDAVEGATIAVRGRIGGRKEAIAPSGGSFLIVDADIPSCVADPEEGCPTPWDYCCEPRERLLPALATVQLVGADGLPLMADLRAAGLAELDEVVVVGTVGPRPSPEVLVIQATGVHRIGG